MYINDIEKIRSYRKKDYYFIRMEMSEGTLDLKFINSNLCKEWMGYLMQAMTFNKYLNERQIFSHADSFHNYLASLSEAGNNRIVNL